MTFTFQRIFIPPRIPETQYPISLSARRTVIHPLDLTRHIRGVVWPRCAYHADQEFGIHAYGGRTGYPRALEYLVRIPKKARVEDPLI